MLRRLMFIVVLLGLLISSSANAIMIGDFPGLAKLIDTADAIVILRIDRHLSDFGSPTLYSTHECYIYQTLKGDIPQNTRINLQLMDTNTDFETPYSHGSTHLMFLMKKADDNEPTDYRTITFKGAQVLLSPLGNETMPEGDTLEEKIRNVIKGAIAYENQQHEKKQAFLKKMLDESGNEGSEVERVKPKRVCSCRVTIEPDESRWRFLLTFHFEPYRKDMEPVCYMHEGIAGGFGLKVQRIVPYEETIATLCEPESKDDRGKIIKISNLSGPGMTGYYDFYNGRDGRKVLFQQRVEGPFPTEEGLYAVTYEHPWEDVEGTNVKFWSNTLLVSVMSWERSVQFHSLFKDNPELKLASYQMKHPTNGEFAKYRRPLKFFDQYIQVGMPYDKVLYLMGSPDSSGGDGKRWSWETSPVGGFWISFEDGKVTSKGFSFDRERP